MLMDEYSNVRNGLVVSATMLDSLICIYIGVLLNLKLSRNFTHFYQKYKGLLWTATLLVGGTPLFAVSLMIYLILAGYFTHAGSYSVSNTIIASLFYFMGSILPLFMLIFGTLVFGLIRSRK